MLEVMTAGDWPAFRQAREHYYAPGLHLVYADADGNLGYHTAVYRPLTPVSPRRALEGWTGKEEVQGRIPLEELPHMLNFEAGYISHANNVPVGSCYPWDLGLATGGTGDTGRSLRLRQLLFEGTRRQAGGRDRHPLSGPGGRSVKSRQQPENAIIGAKR